MIPASISLVTVHARTLLTSVALQERVEHHLRSDKLLRGSFIPGREAFGFRVQGVEQKTSVSFKVNKLNRQINRVEVTFDRRDAKLVGRLFDLLMPEVVDELTLEIFRRAHAGKSAGSLVSWPVELLAA